ncbi:flp operon protein B [Pasteurellaceae bacterium Orientalotternb1]|nr:flp operon protein B [Pasteurellaceae bacterium Orientalotternb1]
MKLLLGILVLLLIRLSWTDIKLRLISNDIVMALLFCVIPFGYMLNGELYIIPALISLFIGFLLFLLNVIGAGDIKLITVLMLTIPSEQILSFFVFTSFFGLLLIIIGWLFFKTSIKRNGLPYGVAISLGFLTNLALFNL